MSEKNARLPLEGVKVLAFTHYIFGPSAAVILADMGAEVIHIEPTEGDPTRRLKGFGIGYYPFFTRNMKTLALDLKSEKGKAVIKKLTETSDVVVENFGPGTFDRLGYDYETMKSWNEKIIYCSLKGFLPGPYENRVAMDEVVQMMGGLAYMTGPTGKPLRAGASVIDIAGGMFGAIGILTALYDRKTTGKGALVKSSLFETVVFIVGQHMAYASLVDYPIPPMPERVSAWSIYRLFDTSDKRQVFIGIISEKHWVKFCEAFGKDDWLNDERLKTNNDRIDNRDWLLPEVEKLIVQFTWEDVINRCDRAGICFAPIATPEDLFDDPQLNATGGLLETTFPDGTKSKLPRLPVQIGDYEFIKRNDPAAKIGEHTKEILKSFGYRDDEIQSLIDDGAIRADD